jgi:hypothetical protein
MAPSFSLVGSSQALGPWQSRRGRFWQAYLSDRASLDFRKMRHFARAGNRRGRKNR